MLKKITCRWLVFVVLVSVVSFVPGCGKTVEDRINELKSPDPSVRWAAAEALGKLGDARAVGPLIVRLADVNWRVREAAAEALGKLGDARAVDPLIACLKDKVSNVRYGAAEALGKLGDKRALEPLIACLKDNRIFVRRTIAEALGKLGDTRAVDPLIACLKDKDSGVRLAAAWALGKLGDTRAVEPLIACLKDEYEDVRKAATEALGSLGDARAVAPLIACLKDEHDVRKAAAEALGSLGDARAVGPLIACLKDGCLKDEYEDVRKAATEALGKLGEPAVAPLIACLKDENSYVRWYAAEALAKLGYIPKKDRGKADYLIARKAWDDLVKLGEPAVEPLIACVKDKDWHVRGAAAEALGRLGDKRAIPALWAALPDWPAKEQIGIALTAVGWRPTSDQEHVYLWVCLRDGAELRAEWAQTRRVLLADVKSGDPRKVENAVYAFVSLGKEEIVEDLIRILDSQGDQEMAETYLNCGHSRLADAAQSWAFRHGYLILPGGGGGEAGWGQW